MSAWQEEGSADVAGCAWCTTGYATTSRRSPPPYNRPAHAARSDIGRSSTPRPRPFRPQNYRYVDYWGTAVTAFDPRPHTELEVTSSSVVRDRQVGTAREDHHLRGLAADGSRTDSTRCSPDALHPGQSQARTGGQADHQKNPSPNDAVIAAARWAHAELRYVPSTTGVHSSGLDALREGRGVCQDFAHLTLISVARHGSPRPLCLGIPTSEPQGGRGDTVDGQSHAWIQAWTGGWW